MKTQKENIKKKGELISKLHLEDRESLISFSIHEFDPRKYIPVKVDPYGKFKLKNGLYEYSSAPKYAGGRITVKVIACEVIVLKEIPKEIIVHHGLYGNSKQESMQWILYL